MLNKGIHRKSMLLYSLLVQRENKHDCVHECEWMSKCALLHRRWQWRRQHQRRLRWRRPNGPKTTQKKNQPHYEGRAKKKENQSKLLVTMKNKTWSYSFIGRCWFTFFFLFIFILPLPLLYASHWVRASERARLCFLVYFFFIHVILNALLLLLFFPLFVYFFSS